MSDHPDKHERDEARRQAETSLDVLHEAASAFGDDKLASFCDYIKTAVGRVAEEIDATEAIANQAHSEIRQIIAS